MAATGTAPLSEPARDDRPLRPAAEPDPVGAVLAAHGDRRRIALTTAATTGAARTAVRTTQSWWASFPAYTELSGVSAGARLWAPGPATATMTLFAAVHARVQGATLVDDPAAATHACLTPALLDRRGDELSAGTRVVVAGDRLLPALARQADEHGLRTMHYYGATELSFVACGTGTAALRPFPGAEVEVRDDVIWVRSPYLCDRADPPGAYRRDPDGWATVGDRGALVDGVLEVRGRPDAVVTAGATVVIGDLEAALAAHAAGPLAVVGTPHPTLGALVTVVLTDAHDRGPVEEFARAHLPASHRPRRWVHLPILPLTSAGKVDRGALARTLADRTTTGAAT